MKALHLVIFSVFFVCSAVSQEKSAQFPDDFFGKYAGTLAISSENSNQNIPMEFHLMPTDSVGTYTYTLIYGEGTTKQVRDYTLRVENEEKGTYVVDENNGIILDDKVIGNRMYALFEVNGTILTTFITFESEHMVFEIVASPKERKRLSYTTDERKTEVISYPITTVQRAVLKKL